MVVDVGEEIASTHRSTVFISYASQDITVADAVVAALERAGVACWIAPRDVVPGALYADEIIRAINECNAVVLLLSARSVASHHVGKELERASSKRRRIITLRTDATELPRAYEYFLSESQWIEVGTGGVEPAAARLAGAVRGHLGTGSNTPVTQDSPMERMPSIAVLPFANMSGDKEQDYFSDGLAEEIINALVRIDGLKVIARTSAFAFKGQNTDIRRIAETLGVANILEGSVRRAGNRIRVTAQLITARDGSHLWSERYDRELTDIFAVQDEISAAISEALKVKLSPQLAAKPRHTPVLPAYEAVLKARHCHWQVTAESMDQARLFHEQAIELDPKYALAHALYAEHLLGKAAMGYVPMRDVVPRIRALAQRALELEPSLVEAHAALCILASTYDYDWDEAGRQFALATPGGRGSALVHFTCGMFFFLGSGRRQEAVEQLQMAVQADPLNLMYRNILAMSLMAVGRQDDAELLLNQTRDLDPNYFITHVYVTVFLIHRDKFAEALLSVEKAYSLAPLYPPSIGLYAALLIRTGESDRGRRMISALGEGEAFGASRALAAFYILCGNIEAAADCYERAIRERDPNIPNVLQGRLTEPIRASARWPRLAALMNLPVASDSIGSIAN